MTYEIVDELNRLDESFEDDDPRIARHRPVAELRGMMRERVRNGEAFDEVRDDYNCTITAYFDLLYATHENSWDAEKLEPWFHRKTIPTVKAKKHLEPYILRQPTEDAIASYLGGKVRTDQLDRMFLDSAIASEMFAFMDEPIAHIPTFSWWGYLANLAISVALLWVSDTAWWAVIVSLFLITGPAWIPLVNKQPKKIAKILQAMKEAYLTLDGPTSSTREIRRALENARDAGVFWPSPLWVLLEDIEARRTAI